MGPLSRLSAIFRRRILARFAVLGTAIAVLGLGGVAVWSTTTTRDETRAAAAAGEQVVAHLRAVQAAGQIDAEADRVMERLDPTVGASIRMAQRELVRSVDRMAVGGLPYDRELARRIRPLLPDVDAAITAFLRAPREQPEYVRDRAEAMEDALDTIQRDLNSITIDPSWLMSQELATAERQQRHARSIVLGLVPLALLLVALGGWLLRGLRRSQAATLRAARDRHAHDARTDQLTGLRNRRSLNEALEARLAAGGSFTLALADLNGFKFYNDTFGHQAGDELLQRLATQLEAACEGAATAFRLGGDEFCVLTDAPVAADVLEQLVAGALLEEGEGFSITSACGTVALPADADSPREALRLADTRMYEAKAGHSGRTADRVESLLRRVLEERDDNQGGHIEAVAQLAQTCADALGVDADRREEIRRAAELHDIGKLAIPASILDKPGALDEDEWRFVRRHTIIGERLLAASRKLHGVGVLVRSTHERWDGTGYPDGLAGTEIPLGARIVAVCEAFCAMTERRPYREAFTPAQAIAELRQCAGSQFDPAVVEQFVRSYERAQDAVPPGWMLSHAPSSVAGSGAQNK